MPRRTWGWHQLDPHWAQQLVTDAGLRPGDLVVDVGAGSGALTRPLVELGARVIAVELHPRRAAQLRQEFGDRVVVVQTDAADLRLPRRDFHVVANPPFGITNALVARLVQRGSHLVSAHLVLQDWAVRRWEGPDAPGARRWRQVFDAHAGRALPRHAFQPAAPRSGRVLVIRRQTRASGAGRPRAPTSSAGTKSTVPSRSGCCELSAVTTIRSPS